MLTYKDVIAFKDVSDKYLQMEDVAEDDFKNAIEDQLEAIESLGVLRKFEKRRSRIYNTYAAKNGKKQFDLDNHGRKQFTAEDEEKIEEDLDNLLSEELENIPSIIYVEEFPKGFLKQVKKIFNKLIIQKEDVVSK